MGEDEGLGRCDVPQEQVNVHARGCPGSGERPQAQEYSIRSFPTDIFKYQ